MARDEQTPTRPHETPSRGRPPRDRDREGITHAPPEDEDAEQRRLPPRGQMREPHE